MKVTVVFCFVLVTIAALVVEAKPHHKIPDDMPEDLKKEAEALHQEVRKWKTENQNASWRDMPEEFKQKFESIRAKYQEATGHEWPKPKGNRGKSTEATQ